MAEALITLVERRNPKSVDDYDRALREVVQEFMLLGLWRAKFFEKAAFYGGTALRILYGLDRFSEDLDFSLLKPDPAFRFDAYFESIRRELAALGLEVELERRDKDTGIESAFAKLNTRRTFVTIGLPDRLAASIPSNRLVKIKFEADIDPPGGFSTETKLALEPAPFGIVAYSGRSLFAGKYHALLARAWQRRVKGRDWFDLVFFVRRDIPVDAAYLRSRLSAAGDPGAASLGAEDMRALLMERIETLDAEAAAADVVSFLADPRSIEVWSRDFFRSIARRIRFE